jgi:tRNA threonylcarbamoyladenosine modification (KEOPS) complex  Pcc1 subunit
LKSAAKISCRFSKKRHAEVVFKALQPDVRKPATLRSSSSLTREDEILVLRVSARDTAALRAALNAYLRWIGSLKSVLEVLERS